MFDESGQEQSLDWRRAGLIGAFAGALGGSLRPVMSGGHQ